MERLPRLTPRLPTRRQSARPFCALAAIACLTVTADCAQAASTGLSPVSNIGANALHSFTGRNAALHGAGIVSTYLLVNADVDYRVSRYFHDHGASSIWSLPVTAGAALGPAVTISSLYLVGKGRADDELIGASYAVFQAVALNLACVSILKAVTGRPHPAPDAAEDLKSQSKTFRFGFLRGGVFWGWPSGHTSTIAAMMSGLMGYYPENRWLAVGGYATIAYAVASVSAFHGGGMHWLSDGVAGALVGYAIGSTVGSHYRALVDREKSNPSVSKRCVLPLAGRGVVGISIGMLL